MSLLHSRKSRNFYGQLKEGKPRIEALQQARRAIKAKYPQPFFWAVFILHGEARDVCLEEGVQFRSQEDLLGWAPAAPGAALAHETRE